MRGRPLLSRPGPRAHASVGPTVTLDAASPGLPATRPPSPCKHVVSQEAARPAGVRLSQALESARVQVRPGPGWRRVSTALALPATRRVPATAPGRTNGRPRRPQPSPCLCSGSVCCLRSPHGKRAAGWRPSRNACPGRPCSPTEAHGILWGHLSGEGTSATTAASRPHRARMEAAARPRVPSPATGPPAAAFASFLPK